MMRSMGQLSRPFVSQSIGKIEDYFGQALDEPERRVVSFRYSVPLVKSL